MSFVTPEPHDPRDPLGLASDAPLLDGWLRFRAAVDAGTTMPFTIPGHKQRTHLVGDVVRGDVPLYAGLDTMKQDVPRCSATRARAAAPSARRASYRPRVRRASAGASLNPARLPNAASA